MDPILQFEISVSIAVQNLGAWLQPVLTFFTFLGNEEFYLVIVPLLYWCVNAGFGLRIGTMLMATNWLNGLLKMAFHSPRPYWVDPQVKAMIAESSFGLPSGHSQNAASLWSLAANKLSYRWGWLAAGLIIFLIGFSRLYLGVHFLRDILTGWLVGFLLLFFYLKVETPVVNWFKKLTFNGQLSAAVLSSLMMVLAGVGIRALLAGWQVPADWTANALLAAPSEPIHPLSLDGLFTVAGTWLGLIAGLAVMLRGRGLMDAGGPAGKRILRYLLGLVGMVILYAGLGAVFPSEPEAVGYSLRMLRYTLIGLWVSAGAPLLFVRMKLGNY